MTPTPFSLAILVEAERRLGGEYGPPASCGLQRAESRTGASTHGQGRAEPTPIRRRTTSASSGIFFGVFLFQAAMR